MKQLTIAAHREGFRRAGRAWSKAPVTVPAADFTKEQIAALRADPNLVVTDGPPPVPEADDPAGVSPFYRERLIRLAVMATPGAGKDGKASVKAIRAATGLNDVSAAERDEHHKAAQAAAD